MLLSGLVFLLSVHVASPNVFTADNTNINVLENGPVTVPFTPSVESLKYDGCTFEYTSLQGTLQDEFLGYDVKDGKRVKLSNRANGWEFINAANNTCAGGIKRDVVGHADMGRYRMSLYVDNVNNKLYTSTYKIVKMYKESDLNISMQTVKDGQKMDLALKDVRLNWDSKLLLSEINGNEVEQTEMISIQLNEEFPKDTRISFNKYSKDAHGRNEKRFTTSCENNMFCSVDFVLGEEKHVTLVTTLDTSIQGYPVITVEQPFTYNGITKTSGHKAVIAVLVILILGVILALVIYTFRKPIFNKIRHMRKNESNENNDDSETLSDSSITDEDDEETKYLKQRIKDLKAEEKNFKEDIERLKNELDERKDPKETKDKEEIELLYRQQKQLEDEINTLKLNSEELKREEKTLNDKNQELKREKGEMKQRIIDEDLPDFEEDPQSEVAVAGTVVKIKVKTSGNVTSVEWLRDLTVNVNKPEYKQLNKKKDKCLFTQEENEYGLHLTVAPKYFGEYVCVARNKKGKAQRSFSIKSGKMENVDKKQTEETREQLIEVGEEKFEMSEKPPKEETQTPEQGKDAKDEGLPLFEEDPQSVVAAVGTEVQFTAKIAGNCSSVQWLKDETKNAKKPQHKPVKERDKVQITHDGNEYKLQLTVAPKFLGDYLCVAQNKKGKAQRSFSIKSVENQEG